jgi:nucleotide-binding universal stress UspA family protein
VELARENKARLTAVRVLDDIPATRLPLPGGMEPGELVAMLANHVRLESEKALRPYLKRHGFAAQCKVLQGNPAIEIIREVLEHGHDVVISGMDHRPGLPGRLFGSTNMHLMRKCPCPVWVVKGGRKRRYVRVLAAVDPARIEPEERALNRKILELGSSLAARDRGQFHVVHAWRLIGESLLRGGGKTPRFELDEVLQTERRKSKERLTELLTDTGVDTEQSRIHLVKGDADIVIPRLVQKEKVDVVVMGTVSRTGIRGLLIGNHAENILGQVDCSVLTVKPDGFVSPVPVKAASQIWSVG